VDSYTIENAQCRSENKSSCRKCRKKWYFCEYSSLSRTVLRIYSLVVLVLIEMLYYLDDLWYVLWKSASVMYGSVMYHSWLTSTSVLLYVWCYRICSWSFRSLPLWRTIQWYSIVAWSQRLCSPMCDFAKNVLDWWLAPRNGRVFPTSRIISGVGSSHLLTETTPASMSSARS
jgi:hypothetical protein